MNCDMIKNKNLTIEQVKLHLFSCPEMKLTCEHCGFTKTQKEFKNMAPHGTNDCLENLRTTFNKQKVDLDHLNSSLNNLVNER